MPKNLEKNPNLGFMALLLAVNSDGLFLTDPDPTKLTKKENLTINKFLDLTMRYLRWRKNVR